MKELYNTVLLAPVWPNLAMVFPFQSSFDHKFGLGEYLTENHLVASRTVNKGSTGFRRLPFIASTQ